MGYYLKNRQLQTGGNSVVVGNGLPANSVFSTSGNISTVGNVTADFYFGNGSQLTGIITSVANINNGTSNITIPSANANAVVSISGTPNVAIFANTGVYVTGVTSSTGNVTGGNLVTGGLVNATGNVTGGNITTNGQVSATGNITANAGGFFIGDGSRLTNVAATSAGFPVTAGTSNISATASGNIFISVANVANVLTVANNGTYTTGSALVTGNITGGNIVTSNAVTVSNLQLTGASIGTTDNSTVVFTGNGGIVIPYGNSNARPNSPDTATLRFNNGIDQVELWDGTAWLAIGPSTSANTVSDAQYTGNGNTTAFDLGQPVSAASILVSLQGVSQLPGVAYTVSGNTLNFISAPAPGDTIDVRFLASAYGHDLIYDASGNALVRTYDTPEITMSINSANALVVNSNLIVDLTGATSLQLPSYTTAQASNIAGAIAGQTIYVIDGDGGNPCLAVYNGSAWKRVTLGATIAP